MRITGSPIVSLIAVVALVVGLALLLLSAWGSPMTRAASAEATGNLDLAIEGYSQVQGRYDSIAPAKQMIPSAYQASIANELKVLFLQKEYDKVIEKAALSPSTASIHFWAGCALFERGRFEENRDDSITWLSRAEDEFRKALEREPDSWNTKYNYELVKALLAELTAKGEEKQEKLIPLLRPKPAPVPERRVG